MDGRIAADGVSISYTLIGSGPPVVLLHGWTCNRLFWREQVPFLARDHRVLAPDFRGHGQSEVPDEGYTLERLAEDVHIVMRDLKMSPAVIVGHSMGGMVAQQLAASHGEDVSGLVLMATAAADPEGTLLSKRIAAEAPREGYRAAFLRYFPQWFIPEADPDLLEWVKSQMIRTPEPVSLGLVRSYQDLDLRPGLREVRVPSLVIGATGDVSAPPLRSQELARLITGARLVVIDGVGHFVQLERPAEVNGALAEYLSQHAL